MNFEDINVEDVNIENINVEDINAEDVKIKESYEDLTESKILIKLNKI